MDRQTPPKTKFLKKQERIFRLEKSVRELGKERNPTYSSYLRMLKTQLKLLKGGTKTNDIKT